MFGPAGMVLARLTSVVISYTFFRGGRATGRSTRDLINQDSELTVSQPQTTQSLCELNCSQ